MTNSQRGFGPESNTGTRRQRDGCVRPLVLLTLGLALIALAFQLTVGGPMVDWLVRPMLYPVPDLPVPSPPPEPLREEPLSVPGLGRISAWSLDAETSANGRPAILFLHGNGENLEALRLMGTLEQLRALGASVLAIDYPGYGHSEGRPSEASLRAAGVAALRLMEQRFPGQPKVIVGWSLGAAVAAQVAGTAGEELAGLVLISPWADLSSLAGEHFPRWMVGLTLGRGQHRYDSVQALQGFAQPMLVVHGKEDRIIPVGHGRRLAESLADARWLEVPGAGHNDLLGRAEPWQALSQLLQEIGEVEIGQP